MQEINIYLLYENNVLYNNYIEISNFRHKLNKKKEPH